MHRIAPGTAAICLGLLLQGCGGGGSGGSAPPLVAGPPPPPPPAKAALTATNYRNAVTLSFGSSISAFTYVRLGVDALEELFGLPPILPLPPAIPLPCGESGTIVHELDDRDGNRVLSVNDSASIIWDDCRNSEGMTDGLLRVKVDSITAIAGGRDLTLTVTVVSLTHTRFSPASSTTINFIAPVHYTYTSTYRHFAVASGIFTADHTVIKDNLSLLVIDYLQNYDTNTYNFMITGSVDSQALGGQFDFATPLSFTGRLGEYPTAGRLTVSGGANTSARLAEEGVAAANEAAVLVSVDSTGDGVADTSVADLAWSTIVPQGVFNSFQNQHFVTGPGP